MIVTGNINPQPYKYLTPKILKDTRKYINEGLTTLSGIEDILYEVLTDKDIETVVSKWVNVIKLNKDLTLIK